MKFSDLTYSLVTVTTKEGWLNAIKLREENFYEFYEFGAMAFISCFEKWEKKNLSRLSLEGQAWYAIALSVKV